MTPESSLRSETEKLKSIIGERDNTIARLKGEAGWFSYPEHRPPRKKVFLARNPGHAPYFAEWSDLDRDFVFFDSKEGWRQASFTQWHLIPD